MEEHEYYENSVFGDKNMKKNVTSKQFPVSSKDTIWALWYGKQKILHGSYPLCVWKMKQMIKDGLKAKEMKIIVEEVKLSKPK